MAKFVPRFEGESAVFDNGMYLPADSRRQHFACRTKELQSVPLGRIMAGGDLNAAGRRQVVDGQTRGGGRAHADIGNAAADAGQPGDDGMAEHRAAWSAIPAEDDGLALDVGSQSGGKGASQLG